MFEDDDRRLVRIADIACAVARGAQGEPWRGLIWLVEQVEAGALPARLYIPVIATTVDTQCVPPEESKSIWRSLAKRAKAQRSKDMLDYFLPSAASTWHVHVIDLMQFASTSPMPEAVVVELNKLAEEHRGTLPFPARLVAHAESAPVVAIDERQESAKKPLRPDERPVQPPAKTHTLINRSDVLAAVLTEATKQAVDSNDWSSAWAALVQLARSVPPPAPLAGYVEGQGVQYRADKHDDPIQYLSREAFRKRFKRKYG